MWLCAPGVEGNLLREDSIVFYLLQSTRAQEHVSSLEGKKEEVSKRVRTLLENVYFGSYSHVYTIIKPIMPREYDFAGRHPESKSVVFRSVRCTRQTGEILHVE